MNPFTDFKAIVIYALAALVAVLGLATWQYKRMFQATDFALAVQNNAIKAQNTAAEQLLKKRTAERDALQEKLDERAAAQEKTDDNAVGQIAADDKRQRAAPVRVSVHKCASDAGRGGGNSASGAAASAQAGAGDASTASGVLSEAAAGRLADALNEVETLSAAYASCRTSLLSR